MQQETLEALDTPELDALLQEELSKEDTDAEQVRQISKVLRDRNQEISPEVSPEVQALFDQFVRQSRRKAKLKKLGHKSWGARAAAALVAVVIAAVFALTVLPMEAQAGSWWDRITQLSGEIFEFISHRNASKERPAYVFDTDNPGLQEVYDAVVSLGVTDPVVPMWLPDGYVLDELKQIPMKTKTLEYARFSSGSKNIIYMANIYGAEEGFEYNINKKEKNVTEYENAGVTHYVMENKEKCVAVWTKKNVECSLTIDGSEDIIYKVLDSIYIVRR